MSAPHDASATRGRPKVETGPLVRPRIDRAGPLPLYFQLKQALVREIRDRQLRPGDRLPTEAEIEEAYGVSRSTIRQALSELVVEGVVERIQGKGTFVAASKAHHVPMLTSFTENMRAQGYVPSRKVLESRVAGAPANVAALLSIDEAQPCRFLRRLLCADDRPVGIAETWLPADLLGDRDELFHPDKLDQGSLYDLLQGPDIALVLHRGVETITPGVADEDHAQLLDCVPGSPVLVVDRLSYTPDEQPIEWTHMVFGGSRYEYQVQMVRPRQQTPVTTRVDAQTSARFF